MTLKTKSAILFVLIASVVIFSFKLFADYNTLHHSMVTNLFISGNVPNGEMLIYRSLTGSQVDVESARAVVREISGDMKAVNTKALTQGEFHDLTAVQLSFMRIESLLKDLPSGPAVPAPALRQINNELLRISDSVKRFRASFTQRMDSEIAKRTRLQALILITTGFGLTFLFFGFYRAFLRPLLDLSSQVESVKNGKTENIPVNKHKDEIGRLSDFTYQAIAELRESYEALSDRHGMQFAISEILQAGQKTEDIDVFFKKALDIILSIRWLSIQNKAGIYLVDEEDPERLVLRAEKNYSEIQKKVCVETRMGKCLCGRVAQSGKGIFKSDCNGEHDKTYSGMTPHGHYCVPIKQEDKVLGVINLYVESGHALSKTEMDFIDAVSLIVAEALIMKKLTQSEHLITRALEESGEAAIIANREGSIEYVNPALERITGYSAGEFMGKNLIEGLRPWELTDDILRSVKYGESWSGTVRNKRKDGADCYAFTSIIPVKDERGEVIKFVSISRDITKERMLEEQLRHAQKIDVVGRLAGGVAHDFNNILTAIIGYTRLLRDALMDEKLKGYADIVLLSSQRAAALTKSLLAFSRKQAMSLLPVNLNDTVKGVEGLLSRLLSEDMEIKIDLSDTDLKVMADSGQIEQVLMNLATNARDAMPQGGTLTVKAEPVRVGNEYANAHIFPAPGAYACLTVSDTGTGMDEETKRNIFEPFFTTKELGKGTGLGLSIVYGIVKQHGGAINVYSEPGMGTVFKIYLPLINGKEEAKEGPFAAAPRGGTETVLLAEDDRDVRRLIKEILEKYGYAVIEAVDGEDAVKAFTTNKDKIQMLLFDVLMPKKNGREAYEEIKKISPEVKALFMSGYAEDFIHGKGMLETGLDFMHKPILPEDLLMKMRERLDR